MLRNEASSISEPEARPDRSHDLTAAMCFVAGTRRLLADTGVSPEMIRAQAAWMEERTTLLPTDQREALLTAARWMRRMAG